MCHTYLGASSALFFHLSVSDSERGDCLFEGWHGRINPSLCLQKGRVILHTIMTEICKAQLTSEAKHWSTLEFQKESIRCHQSVNNSLGIYLKKRKEKKSQKPKLKTDVEAPRTHRTLWPQLNSESGHKRGLRQESFCCTCFSLVDGAGSLVQACLTETLSWDRFHTLPCCLLWNWGPECGGPVARVTALRKKKSTFVRKKKSGVGRERAIVSKCAAGWGVKGAGKWRKGKTGLDPGNTSSTHQVLPRVTPV